MRRWALTAVVLAAGLAGCGGDGGSSGVDRPTMRDPVPRDRSARQNAAPVRPRAPVATTRVIRRWADTLRGGDVRGAARFFALPSVVQLQPTAAPVVITELRQAVAFNRVLPCGARLLRAELDGRYVNALFRLTMRRGATCDAPGTTARTDFVVRAGKITEWRRAPDEAGDPENDGAPAERSVGGPAV
jgi:hypothetical protein